jgi:hypothetical protein
MKMITTTRFIGMPYSDSLPPTSVTWECSSPRATTFVTAIINGTKKVNSAVARLTLRRKLLYIKKYSRTMISEIKGIIIGMGNSDEVV